LQTSGAVFPQLHDQPTKHHNSSAGPHSARSFAPVDPNTGKARDGPGRGKVVALGTAIATGSARCAPQVSRTFKGARIASEKAPLDPGMYKSTINHCATSSSSTADGTRGISSAARER